MERVPLVKQDDLPEEYQYLLDEEAMGEINLLCAMANNPEILQTYMRYGTTIWKESGLDKADLERCILAIARTLESEYEWQQHVPIARTLGVPDEDIQAISEDNLDHFDDRRESLIRYVQAVVDGDVDDEIYSNFTAHVDDSTVVGATQLATHYLATATFLDALDVPLEDPFVGWKLESD